MYRKYILQMICALVVAVILQACESRISTEGDAFENEKSLREQEGDSFGIQASADGKDRPAILADHAQPGQAAGEKKIPKPSNPALDPWQVFQNSLTQQIAANETLIWHLKVLPNNAKNLKRILSAERENADLRTQIVQFQAEEKAARDKFMVQMNTALDGIGSVLKESQGNGE